MKPIALAAAAATLLLSASASAQDVSWSGEISSAVGTGIWKCADSTCPLTNYNNRNVFRLKLDASITEQVVAVGELSIRNVNESTVESADDSTSVDNVQPIDLIIMNAYVEGYDVLPGFDLKVGAQRIQWGTADGYRPTDRINAFDLQDPVYFDRRLPSVAATGTYHVGDFSFSASWIPFFTPSLLAPELVDIATSEEATDTIEVDLGDDDPPDIRNLRTRTFLPDGELNDMQYAVRAVWNAPIADFSLGYFYGRDTLPNLDGEVIPESFFSTEEIDIVATLQYPKLHMIATDARGPIAAGITGWFEMAFVIPDRTQVVITEQRLLDLQRLNIIDNVDGPVEADVQTGDPYPSFVVGLDRSFGDITYVNLQYLYGFLFERNPSDLHHYAILNLRFPSYDNWIEFDTRGGMEANPDLDAFGWLASGRLTTRFADVFRFSLLAALQNGQKDTTLRLFRPISEIRIEAGAKF